MVVRNTGCWLLAEDCLVTECCATLYVVNILSPMPCVEQTKQCIVSVELKIVLILYDIFSTVSDY